MDILKKYTVFILEYVSPPIPQCLRINMAYLSIDISFSLKSEAPMNFKENASTAESRERRL